MNFLIYLIVLLFVFASMEAITSCTHRFIMHGLLWKLHEDHHRPRKQFLEKNDAFFLIFAVPSFLSILWGTLRGHYLLQAAGFGIMAYGAAYFVVHDVIIHRRFKWLSRLDSPYVKAIRFAHKMQHKHLDKENGEAFGLLFIPRKYRQRSKKTT